MDNHTLDFDGISLNLRQGLDSEQVRRSVEKHGRNTLTPPPRDPWWVRLLEKFEDPTIRILLVAAVISLAMTVLEKSVLRHPDASFIDSIGIFLAVALATLAGFFSEMKSAREFELLNKVKDDILVKVLRNGQVGEISINDIVVGDLVRLDLGDKVPADGVVVDALGLLVDQSVMTGESVPVEKSPTIVPDTIDDAHLVYRGTMISDGHGLFLVTQVGDKTKLGQIAANLGRDAETENATPLTLKLSILAKQISVVGMTGAMAIFAVMAGTAIHKSPIFRELTSEIMSWNLTPALILVGVSLLFGFLAVRFGLKPFFGTMGITIRNPLLLTLMSLPLIAGAFGVALAFWWMIHLSGGGETVVFHEPGTPPLDAPAAWEWALPQSMELFRSLLTCFIVAVTIIVVAVPEGLPMMVTVSLAMNMMKMARENCLIRKLVASETIGSATVVCTDKTGTLTQNKMEPVWFFFGMKEYDLHDLKALKKTTEWDSLIDSIAINSEADLKIERTEHGETVTGIGNPTECAMLLMLHRQGVDYRDHREEFPRIYELSHNSQRKLSMVVVDRDGGRTSFLKGAPERILSFCDTILHDQHIDPLEEHREALDAALEHAADKALRVIAFSRSVRSGTGDFDPETCFENRHDTLIGLLGIADPIRPEVAQAVATCREAGVEVKMITGDAEPTAVAIAKQAGILHESKPADSPGFAAPDELVLTSDELAKISDEELPDVVKHLRVLARSTPMDKLRLVKAMHRQGEVVAMTGDGTNDAPALKFADVGISMGMVGTEVAKEASDIVLIDDNFKSIVTGIWWGRTLYQNIQRFLQFQLSVNVVALSCALIGPLVGIPLPLTVPQLLWINIIMDTFAAIALSTDPPRKSSMKRKPVARDASIITPSMGVSILLNSFYQVAILFMVLYGGWFVEDSKDFRFYADPREPENVYGLTVFFTVFVMFQFWHKFNCRSLRHDESPFALLHKNRLFLLIVGAITLSQIVMVQASDHFGIGSIFRTVPLSLTQWIGITLLTATILPVAWLVRQLISRLGLEDATDGKSEPEA